MELEKKKGKKTDLSVAHVGIGGGDEEHQIAGLDLSVQHPNAQLVDADRVTAPHVCAPTSTRFNWFQFAIKLGS